MPIEIVNGDPVRAHGRRLKAERRFQPNARCACGESRPEALIPGTEPVMCAECQRALQGKSVIDLHHPFGEANCPVTIPIPANDHRSELNTAQYLWAKKTLENPQGSPLRALAAMIRGLADSVACMLKPLLRGAEMLECLDSFLAEKLGPLWWRGTTLEEFAPKRKNNDQF